MQDVTLTWKGVDYVVEARDVLPMIAKIEEIVTIFEIGHWGSPEKVSLSKLAMAYGVALRHAGARVSNDEVFEGMFDARDSGRVARSIQSLMSMMIPPDHLQEKGGGSKKAEAATPAANSSKRRTKRESPGG